MDTSAIQLVLSAMKYTNFLISLEVVHSQYLINRAPTHWTIHDHSSDIIMINKAISDCWLNCYCVLCAISQFMDMLVMFGFNSV